MRPASLVGRLVGMHPSTLGTGAPARPRHWVLDTVRCSCSPPATGSSGSFVWFPEGMLMEHGATDDGPVTTLFITNKPFDIRYAFEDERASSTGS